MNLDPGRRVLGRYVVERLLGQGGMGAVYRGRHESLGYAVALKVIHEVGEPDLIARFLVEAHAMARVRHPNVVSILDYGVIDGATPCIAMEYVPGQTLFDRLACKGIMSWGELGPLVAGLLAGLHVIHEAGIVHRDLKPANLLIATGRPSMLKVLDFGIARIRSQDRLTRAGAAVGTPEYMALEQAEGKEVDRRADLYSIGLILYEALTGTLPCAEAGYTAPLQRVLKPILPPAVPSGHEPIPAPVVSAIMAALAEDVHNRPLDAERLAALLARSSIEAASDGPAAREPAAALPGTAGPSRAAAVIDGRAATHSAPAHDYEPGTLLFAAAISATRLASRDERAWLATQASGARSFTLAGRVWVVLVAVHDLAAARERAAALSRAVETRFGAILHAWAKAPPTFAITTAMLAGAVALPAELNALITAVQAAPDA